MNKRFGVPNKKIGITTIYVPLNIESRTDLVAVIGDLTFVKEEDSSFISVFMGTRAENEKWLEDIYFDEEADIKDLDDLKILATNWYFDNVEIIKPLEEE
jgi:hypothetical protein